ncbi:MAG: DUF5698 domain-containing protein [Clostridium sp.]|nr:DUF5698 domain-containing protein [Clostridium sp.]MCM1444157.1 DUF5698 domain-containing protein [Candidatus Amulumruptor caecigallinarius]
MIYFIIFISKVIENALSTMRLIVVANGKKIIGAILQLFISLVWIIITGIVIIDVSNDYFKVIAFILGTSIGSYIGSLIEESIAMGNNMITCIINPKYKKRLLKILKDYKIINTKDNGKIILLSKRKNKNEICKIIKSIDKSVVIIIEKVLLN